MTNNSNAFSIDVNHAWRLAYRSGLERLPDDELRWEFAAWQSAGAVGLAALVIREMEDRRSHDASIPGGADAAALSRLFSRVPREPVGRLVQDEALPLVEAMRLVYWAGLQEVAQ